MSVAAPTTGVRMFDYRQQWRALREEILAEIESVLESGTLILGPRVRQFETHFVEWLAFPGQGVGVGNGTDAIALALRAVGVGPGDDVLTVPNTAIPTVSAIRMIGARPVFCDVRNDTLQLDPAEVPRRLTAKAKAIVPVHLFGNAVELDPILDLARQHNLHVVEDCAQATGTRWKNDAVGTRGDVGCFSFYPTKNLGAYGDGGLCVTRDPDIAERLRRLRFYGCGTSYYAEQEGVNSRLDELQAAILDVKLKHLDAAIDRRRAIAARYDAELSDLALPPATTPGAMHSYHLYVVRSPRREAWLVRLRESGIGCAIHYPTPIHRMRGYEFLGYSACSLPIAEQAAEEVFSLPCYPELTDDEVSRVIETMRLGID